MSGSIAIGASAVARGDNSTAIGSTNSVAIGNPLRELYATVHSLGKLVEKQNEQIAELRLQMQELYYAPGMPGAVIAAKGFRDNFEINCSGEIIGKK